MPASAAVKLGWINGEAECDCWSCSRCSRKFPLVISSSYLFVISVCVETKLSETCSAGKYLPLGYYNSSQAKVTAVQCPDSQDTPSLAQVLTQRAVMSLLHNRPQEL